MRKFHYEVGYITHPGNRREVNQDSLLIRRGSLNDNDFMLLTVADGMGGMLQGEEASGLAARFLDQWWQEKLPSIMDEKFDWSQVEAALRGVIDSINWTLSHADTPEGKRSGTTLTLLFLYRGEYRILHIGDSRAYLLHGGELVQLTQDQTWCRAEIDAGRMTEEEARTHPMRHVLISALGVTSEYILNQEKGKLPNGGSILLCSDGFYQELPGGWPGAWMKEPVQSMLEVAASSILEGSADDNLTAVMVRMTRSWR